MLYLFSNFRGILSLGLFLFFLNSVSAQTTINGKVTDDKGGPLSNVSVIRKGTSKGVTAAPDGSFTIDVPNSKSVLIFSSVGYENKEVAPGSKTNINVQLKSISSQLNEVVVVGY